MKFSKSEVICREDLAYPEGALVCDGYDDAGRLVAHPLGGGFQLTVPAQDEPRFRVVAEGEKGAALFHRGRFTLSANTASSPSRPLRSGKLSWRAMDVADSGKRSCPARARHRSEEHTSELQSL